MAIKYYVLVRAMLLNTIFFDATWEEEHGAGVLMAGFDVLDTGNQDHAYYTYALH